MKTAFITFEDFLGKKDIGSSRIRAKYLIDRWSQAGPDIGEAELFKFGGRYDAVVFQKAYWWEFAEKFEGIKILDLCDPDFLHWGYPIYRMIEACHVITCSSERLAAEVAGLTSKPVHFIPDCILDVEKSPRKLHFGPVRSVAWFGYAENFPVLNSAVPALAKRGLDLVVISSKPYNPPAGIKINFRNLPWTAENWIDDFMRADMVINPQSLHGRFAFKSDNKTTQAWAVGMPVAGDDKELDEIIALTPTERQARGDSLRQWAIENRDIRQAVEQMKTIINGLSPAKPNVSGN